jgi:hypothetical protein
MKFRLLLILLFFGALPGCGPETRESKYKELSVEQREIADLTEKRAVVHSLVCEQLLQEINAYRLDRKNKEFKPFHKYFYDYPSHFKRLQGVLYPSYKKLVSDRLVLRGAYGIDPEFKDWQPPEISDLPCQKITVEWKQLKNEWGILQNVIPEEFYKQDNLSGEIDSFIKEAADKTNMGRRTLREQMFLFVTVGSFAHRGCPVGEDCLLHKHKLIWVTGCS